MATKNLLVKNIPFDRVRAVITASQSSVAYTYYSEGQGNRYYVNSVTSTASSTMESATFESYLSFTMSGNQTYSFDLVPMDKGNSVVINTIIYAQNSSATKGFAQSSFGAWKHSGSTLTDVGTGMVDTTTTDFSSGVHADWSAAATASVRLTCVNTTSEVLDWDIHISYKKGFHSIATNTTQKPIYPEAPSS